MTPAGPTRARDHLDPAPASKPEVDLASLLGTWVVFESGTTGITKVVIEAGADAVEARVYGSGADGQPDWGTAPAQVFADDVAGSEAWAFRSGYDHGWQRVELFGYLNRGVLAVDAGTSFIDGGDRSDYFTRELFYRL
ncbi:MAG: hypothetical protein ACHQJ5_02015 [Vicinamibacteria bacterium]|jgi:hypothetical protein